MNKFKKYSKLQIQNAVNNSRSFKDVILNLNLRAAGSNYKSIHAYCKFYDIDTSEIRLKQKEDKSKNAKKLSKKIPLEEILIINSTYSRTSLKKRLFDENLKTNICEICGQDENWHGKKITLILDHINGVFNDNRIENLRIVCPNCETTLDTHAGKNNKRPDKTCIDCKIKINRQSTRCINCHFIMISNKKYKKNKEKESKKINSKPRYNSRKVIRPNYIDLINDINQYYKILNYII